MFYLHVSNRTENLLHHLCEVLRLDKQESLFDKELFLIQSQGMERMVAQKLADEFVSFCNFQFFLPIDFLGFIAGTLGLGISPDGFNRQILGWRIDGLLHQRRLGNYPELESFFPLRRYLSGENKDVKRFQLSVRLANLFDQYQLMRGDILQGWQQNRLSTDNPSEIWQRELWISLLAQPGGAEHRGVLLDKIIRRLQNEGDLSPLLPKRVSVFGVHTMPPVFLQYLNGLAKHMDVHLFLLSPCKKYWGNVESMRLQYKKLARYPAQNEQIAVQEHHPLLACLGQQGRDLQNMMLDGADFTLEFASYEDPAELVDGMDNSQFCLLHRIQSDLLKGHMPTVLQQPFDGDRSVQIVSCHSKMRELAVLKDQLLDLLHNDSNLELKDIVVMAPDIQQYSTLIPAVFDEIQHSIADRSVRRSNPVLATFISFLELFSGRYEFSAVMDVLQQSSVYSQFDLSGGELDQLKEWLEGAGVRWGLSSDQRQSAGILAFEEGSWRAGLDRLLMGYAIGEEVLVDGVLPFSGPEGKAAAPLGGLCMFIELLVRGEKEFTGNYQLKEWSALLLECIDILFGQEYEKELSELKAIVADLGDIPGELHEEGVSYDVIIEWIKAIGKEARSSSGFLRGQLTFCSMLPMRSIPFQIVCLLGLDDGVFPKSDHHDTFDLMNPKTCAPRPGDRSGRADDRYQFLEAILAARSVLYLSFVGQSIKTNESIPPSVVVSEFLDMLEKGYGIPDPVVRHPLHPFSSKYFAQDEHSGFFSYDSHYCSIAEAFRSQKKPVKPWWQGSLDPVGEVVRLKELVSFYQNPQKYFVKDRLGIRLDAGVEAVLDSELFEVTGLDSYRVEQYLLELFGTTAQSKEVKFEELLKQLQVMGHWPLGSSGMLSLREKFSQIKLFWSQVENLQFSHLGNRVENEVVDLQLGSHRLVGTLANLYEKGGLIVRFGKLRGRDLMHGWIKHLVAAELLAEAGSSSAHTSTYTYLVATDGCYSFSIADVNKRGPDLRTLLQHFSIGSTRPLPYYVEPSFNYARQQQSKRAKIPPLVKAVDSLKFDLEKGYQPEWELLLSGGGEFFESGSEFEQLALDLMCPLYEMAMEQQVNPGAAND